MDILIGFSPYETTFKGSQVTIDLRPLTTELYKVILPYMKKVDDKEEATQKILEMVGKSLPIFQGHVQNIKGLTINGIAPTPEQIHRETVLVHLAADIIQELFLRSTMTEEERKNLKLPSEVLKSDDTKTPVSKDSKPENGSGSSTTATNGAQTEVQQAPEETNT